MQKYRVFLVDDDEDDRNIFEEALTGLELETSFESASNGREALDRLGSAASLPDILFVDVNMPVMNGMELLDSLKNSNTYKMIPVYMYSTSSAPSDIATAEKLGAEGYIIKHTSFRLLTEELKETLEKYILK